MARNIVVFSDGTGQEGGERYNTNIYKLFNMVEDRSSSQIAFYDAGLGTGWHKIAGNVGGMGISRNIRQCYRFIFDNFEAGDRIFLFGFSRGAATVRSLSSFIHYFGILPKSRPELISRAYGIYKIRDAAVRKQKANDFLQKNRTMWTRIQFVGCFDTVAALGLPWRTASAMLDGIPGFRHRFHNFSLSPSVENAFHALAIDDERKTFHPVLWDAECLPYQQVRQVWFSGMHTDVGGGYKEQNLSDIPLAWMTQNAIEHGLRIFRQHADVIAEDANGFMHDSRSGWLGKLYRRQPRSWDNDRPDQPVIHQSVLERRLNANNQESPPYKPWITQGEYQTEPWTRHVDQDDPGGEQAA